MADIHDFHAHIYFDPDQLDRAQALGRELQARFGVPLGHFHVRPVGPHPRGSCQMTVPTERFGEVATWLAVNRAGLTIFAKKGDPLRSRPFPSAGASRHRETFRSLLELDGAAGFLDLLLDLLGFVLVDAFLDGLRSAFDQRLGFAEAEPVMARTSLMTLIFLPPSPVRITSNSVCSSAAGPAAAAAAGDGNRSGGRNAPLLFEQPWRARRLRGRSVRQLVDELVDVSHFKLLAGTSPHDVVRCEI
jgi:aromatic ring-cleaving dioxygenase